MTSRAELERRLEEYPWKRALLLEVLVPLVVGAAVGLSIAALVIALLS